MGNCVQSSINGSGCRHGAGGGEGGRLGQIQRRRSEEAAMMEDHQGAAAAPPSVVNVKMVLTKGELGWLVARLKAGDRRLGDVLHEMARKKRDGRAGGSGDGWRPSLESIVECPAETDTAADS